MDEPTNKNSLQSLIEPLLFIFILESETTVIQAWRMKFSNIDYLKLNLHLLPLMIEDKLSIFVII